MEPNLNYNEINDEKMFERLGTAGLEADISGCVKSVPCSLFPVP